MLLIRNPLKFHLLNGNWRSAQCENQTAMTTFEVPTQVADQGGHFRAATRIHGVDLTQTVFT